MKIKKFQARNFSEALALVKKEMGDEAVILSSEEQKGIRSSVVVTAAMDYDMNQYNTEERRNERAKADTTIFRAPDSVSSELERFKTVMTGEVKNEIGNLREIIENMKNNGYEMSLPTKKKVMLHFLKRRSIVDEFAMRLCNKARDLNDIPSLILADIKTKGQNIGNKKAIMLIGPTGVGKTTTIAKLAASALKDGKKAAIISLDTYRIGAIEQIRIYSKIIGIPIDIASDIDELNKGLSKYSDRDIIFIDTTGRNPMDETYMNELSIISNLGFPIETHLLISVNSNYDFMAESYNYYKRLPLDYVAFTKIDEAIKFGSIYNLFLLYQKPIAYITTGQRVPDDIEFPDSKRLARLILKYNIPDLNAVQKPLSSEYTGT